jgi:three-Cys-motif partner protein
MAILFSTQARYGIPETLFYFDGFAGPGVYYVDDSGTTTCDGSPVIVARAANDFIQQQPSRKVVIMCTDRDKQCVASLTTLLDALNSYGQTWRVQHAEFDQAVNTILDGIETANLTKFPMFFFIDPFGYSGYPLTTLRRIMAYPRAELLINFMVYDLVRFACEEKFQDKITALYGSTDYLCFRDAPTAEQRQAFLLNMYCETLRVKGGARYVMPFRINRPGFATRPRYYLVHASQNIKALRVMKDEMWKQSDTGYRFEAVGVNTDQLALFEDPDAVALKERIECFCVHNSPVTYDALEEWAYATTNGVAQTVKQALLELEASNRVSIDRGPRQRKATVASGATIRGNRGRP